MAIGMIDDSTLYDIADAIREKTETTTEYLPSEMSNAIRSIETGIQLPTIDEEDLGKASDLAANKQLIDSNGNVVTGTLGEVPTGSSIFGTHDHVVGGTKGDTKFNVKATWDGTGLDGAIIRGGICPGVRNVPTSLLGDAELSDVAKGKTFTSIAGYLAIGTREESNVQLPSIDESVLGTASDLAKGKQLIGPDGSVVAGSVETVEDYEAVCLPEQVGTQLFLSKKLTEPILIRGGYIDLQTSLSNFGEAERSDVRAGVTFTSKNGLKLTGEMEVQAAPILQEKNVDPSTSPRDVTPDSGYDGLSKVTVSAIQTETKTVTSNGTYIPSNGKYFSSVSVNVSASGITPSGTLSITENGTFDVTQYASVNVNVTTSSGYKSGDIVKAFPASATLASGYNVSSVSASDSVTKNENGVVSLSGVTSTVAIGSIDNVKGRYVKASSGSIYYVPADATITQGGSTYNKTYTVDKANLMFVLA